MNKLLLQLTCFVNLIILQSAVGYEGEDLSGQRAHDFNDLITRAVRRLQNSLALKDDPGVIVDLKFSGLNPDSETEEYGSLFHNSSSKCADDILYILLNIKSQWALSVFDSFGKPESGILKGNFKWIGDYNECVEVLSRNPNATAGNFRGKYCSLSWPFPILNASVQLPFVSGLCVPDSCSSTELQSILEFTYITGAVPHLNDSKSTSQPSITCKPTERPLNAPAKAVIAVLSVFFTLAVLGSSITAVRYFKGILAGSRRPSLERVNFTDGGQVIENNSVQEDRDDESLLKDDASGIKNGLLEKLQTFLLCFCVFTNGAKILNTDASEGQLLCIHGIRFLSMSWVILGHTYATCYGLIRNPIEAMQMMNNFPFQIVLQGFYSVDSFFLLSGFLLGYLSMKEFSKTKGSISWTYFYIHRYLRLTPIYMVVLWFSTTVYFYMGSGPFWPDNVIDPVCKKNWWWNLLYINNFAKATDQCMAWSWYLANDMQFFVISPLFLITLWRWPKIGYGVSATFLSACWISNFYITYHYDLKAGFTGLFNNSVILNFAQFMETYLTYFDKIYIKPYTRIAPYIIGLLLGYILFRHKQENKPKYSWVFLLAGWTIATSITLACVYGLYNAHPSVIASSFYNALHRTTFALGLSWVIYVCLIGQGGVVNSILSYKLFIPLSRLTYTAYLIHPMILGGYFSSMKTSLEFSQPTIVYTYLGAMLVSYGLSLPVALVLESPIVSLEKIIRKSFTKKEGS